MSDLTFTYDVNDEGISLRCDEQYRAGLLRRIKTKHVDVSAWSKSSDMTTLAAMARIEAAIEDGDERVTISKNGLTINLGHSFVAGLTDSQARALSLPDPIPFTVRVETTGAIFADANATVSVRFQKLGGKTVSPDIVGSIAKVGSKDYRLPAHIYQLLQLISKLQSNTCLEHKLEVLGEVKACIESITGGDISVGNSLQDIKIAHGSAVSLQLAPGESFQFDPILFDSSESRENTVGAENLLTPRQQQAFSRAFRHRDGSKSSYLADDVFVYIDPSIRVATQTISKMQRAPADERRRFVSSPQSFIRDELINSGHDEEFVDELIDATFIVTDELSNRVKELGLWVPPAIPFKEHAANDWTTIEFGIRVGDSKVLLSQDELDKAESEIEAAIANKQPSVKIDDSRELPATQSCLDAVKALKQSVADLNPVDLGELPEEHSSKDDDKLTPAVLIVETNYDNETFKIDSEPRSKYRGYEQAAGLVSTPKEHQVTGIEWLQECWSVGYSGALLADDMGLGKTFQTLAFLAWLKSKRQQLGLQKQPVLIVAPTSLLGTWQAEAELHMDQGNLGEFALLYGSHLRGLRTTKSNDVSAGYATLDLSTIKGKDWILTTYETMRDFHISIAQIRFSCAVFDEMQKIKNETSLMTNAARALNIDFKLGLTGTPVENSLQDLWSILDTLMPGALGLGSMREFTQQYITIAKDNPDEAAKRLVELNNRLANRLDDKPAPMIRRMKSEVAKDLPNKLQHTVDGQMNAHQAECYHEALTKLRDGRSRTQKLEGFHGMRSSSLHPAAFDGSDYDTPEQFIEDSARLVETFKLLDEIHRKGEKVLIFVESIEMHQWLSLYLKIRYDMAHKPDRIFGGVSASARQKIVERFQDKSNSGFDVLLLSPKAAGVGLTLTAANNVIHLTRWWNPAVEDQCTDRAYRIGQTQDVNVYLPRAKHPAYGERSFDYVLHELLERKRQLSRDVLVPANSDKAMNEMIDELNVQVDS